MQPAVASCCSLFLSLCVLSPPTSTVDTCWGRAKIYARQGWGKIFGKLNHCRGQFYSPGVTKATHPSRQLPVCQFASCQLPVTAAASKRDSLLATGRTMPAWSNWKKCQLCVICLSNWHSLCCCCCCCCTHTCANKLTNRICVLSISIFHFHLFFFVLFWINKLPPICRQPCQAWKAHRACQMNPTLPRLSTLLYI